jgi:hypothetical protein
VKCSTALYCTVPYSSVQHKRAQGAGGGHLTAPPVPLAQTAASSPAGISRDRGTQFQTLGTREGAGRDGRGHNEDEERIKQGVHGLGESQ